MGIDFGTAFTKMAIGLADKVFIVDWDGVHSGPLRYLLSGELSETVNGVFVGRAPSATRVLQDLKLPFVKAEGQSRPEDIANAATFLAWAMKYARAWLYRHHSTLLRGRRLIWEINLGAPTGSWAAGTESLRDEYRRIGLTAWRASLEPTVSVTRTTALLSSTPVSESGWGLDFLGVLPEFAAQIAGYVRSPQRQEGLHLLVDVGAGTLDVACFRIMRDSAIGEDRFPVFASSVQPLGTHYLMRARGASLDEAQFHWRSTDRVPTANEFARATGVPICSVRDADRTFQRLVAQAINTVIDRTRIEMDRSAPEFARDGELPVFLAGGGAHVEVYKNGVMLAFNARAFHHCLRRFPAEAAIESRLPVDAELASRLSVARGLTYDAESIGQLIPPSLIPPDSSRARLRTRPDRDELYPK